MDLQKLLLPTTSVIEEEISTPVIQNSQDRQVGTGLDGKYPVKLEIHGQTALPTLPHYSMVLASGFTSVPFRMPFLPSFQNLTLPQTKFQPTSQPGILNDIPMQRSRMEKNQVPLRTVEVADAALSLSSLSQSFNGLLKSGTTLVNPPKSPIIQRQAVELNMSLLSHPHSNLPVGHYSKGIIPAVAPGRRSSIPEHERKFVCPWPGCPRRFCRRPDLTRHYCIHTNNRAHHCPEPGCHKSFIQKSALVIHIRTHTGERPFECKHCHRRFGDTSTLARHHKLHSGLRPYSCKHCGRTFVRRTALQIHEKTHGINGNEQEQDEIEESESASNDEE